MHSLRSPHSANAKIQQPEHEKNIYDQGAAWTMNHPMNPYNFGLTNKKNVIGRCALIWAIQPSAASEMNETNGNSNLSIATRNL